MQARGERPPTAGTERDEAREQDPRRRAQRHEGECLRGGLQHGCGERRAEGAFDRARIVLKQGTEGAEGVEDTEGAEGAEGADRGCLGSCGGALTFKRSRYSPSVLCSGGSLGSEPASFLILAIASSFSDEASSTPTTRSQISRLERIVERRRIRGLGRVLSEATRGH